MRNRGECTACDAPLRLKKFTRGDVIHFHSAPRIYGPDWHGDDYPAVRCRKCAGRMKTSGCTNFIEHLVTELISNRDCDVNGRQG